MNAAEMSDALMEINDRLAKAAWAAEHTTVTFFCECGDCLAEEVSLSLDEHDEIRARDDLIFAPGHDAPRRYQKPSLVGTPASSLNRRELFDVVQRRSLRSLIRIAPQADASLTHHR